MRAIVYEFIQAFILAIMLGAIAWSAGEAMAKHQQTQTWWGP